jgi:PAS domain S-box-containing protein
VGRENAEKVQDALYRIAELASAADDMQEFYRAIHEIVGGLMPAKNFFIALYDADRRLISWPYWADEIDDDWPAPNEWVEFGSEAARSVTGYVLRTGQPQHLSGRKLMELVERGEVDLIGQLAEDGLGVPLKNEGRTVGVLLVQSYTRGVQYTQRDKDLLAFVGQHIGSALSRARAIEETRERNAELALINSVQSALAGELEMQAIYDVVGDKIKEIFDAQTVLITTYDETTGLVDFPYLVDRGGRQYEDPAPVGGFTQQVIESGEPLMISERALEASERIGSPMLGNREPSKSLLFVPLLTGGRATGAISLQNMDREHAFDDADVRLLTTLAGDLTVALENARLVSETRQRNAELALINSVQSALAGELEMQAIYDVVGDKIDEIFDTQGVAIAIVDDATGRVTFPYLVERGDRLSPEPLPEPAGFTKHVLDTGEPLLINEDLIAEAERVGSVVVAGEMDKSLLSVPLFMGGRANGVISLGNFDREHAFDEADQRLLTTLASSLSVALENARLVHETRQRNAELALINSVQEALAGELEMQAIYDVVGDKIQEIFDAQVVDIAIFDFASGLTHFPYAIERGVRYPDDPIATERSPITREILETKAALLINDIPARAREQGNAFPVSQGEPAQSVLAAPLVAGDEVHGRITLQNLDRTNAFSENDVRLLTTLAGSLSVALENARLVHETRQRNAELALINSVQSALAGELELQAIYDVVGDKIREIFDAQTVVMSVLDEATGLLEFPYAVERGEHLKQDPIAPRGWLIQLLETREPILLTENVKAQAEAVGSAVDVGEWPKSALYVALVSGDKATGTISLQNMDREHAFDEADQRLLSTLAGSLSVALENARLVHETRQRNAELALINSVQAAIAGELDQQSIYDVVGDRIQEIFAAQIVSISTLDEAAAMLHYPYILERGRRLEASPLPPGGFEGHVLATRESVMVTENIAAEAERYGSEVPVGEEPKSVLFVPLVVSGKATGVVSLQNIDREHAFAESDRQLLTTLAGSLSVALENARLVHETRQRNAELALINGVQDAIAGELDPQAIYDAVGDRIQEIFDAQVVSIRMLDAATGLVHHPYILERGERLEGEPAPLRGFTQYVLETRESLLLTENLDAEAEKYGSTIMAGESTKSLLFVPLVTGGKATGVIALENIDREHAFAESDRQLLETLAGSLSVALENARLVHETRQRNAELALINGVQDAIAGELEPQAIYDAVGDRIRDVFDAQAVMIIMLDEASGLAHVPYSIERGERQEWDPTEPTGFTRYVLETRTSLLINEDVAGEGTRRGIPTVQVGDSPKSLLFVPLVTGGRGTGALSLQNVDREHAFTASDQQLLETLAGSLSVALENARLVHETRQRNAELALINGVQDAIAGELEPQAIYDAVGDKIKEVFDAQAVMILILDETTGLAQVPYSIERGERQQWEPTAPTTFTKHVLETRESLLIAEDMVGEIERRGLEVQVLGDAPKSALWVPLVSGGKALGTISLQNVDREHAFAESDQQLLETLAGSLSVALENARLVHETRQRNAELALINGVQEAIAGELEPQAIYDAVGDRIRDVADAQVVSIATIDEASGLVHYPYLIERGERLQAEPRPLAGFAKQVLETREPLLIAENLDAESERYGSNIVAGERPKSVLFVPLVAAGRATGVISLQNIDREHAFGEDDQRLLTTLAGSLTVALENARLVQETRQRVGELATVNSVGQALSSQLDLDALIELVGEQVRETFGADIAYVALHDEAAGRIEFAYYYESGERRPEAPLEYGTGLTTQIIESREPLLLNRKEQHELQQGSVGTPSLSYLGVPILVGQRAIGVISVQSIEEEGRFGEPDVRLLATLAANVGVAIQNARLFTEVEQQRQYFEMLVEVSPAAIVVMDAAERVTAWNPAAAALFGYAADEAIGRTIDELVVPEDFRRESREVSEEARRQGRTHRITRRSRKDGELLDVEMELVPLHFDGDNVGFYAIYHDITELQRAREEAEAATQAKSAFLATMSHEIRTPMNAVIGMTDLLLGTELTGEQREFAEVVHSSGDALLHVIDDILDYSKIEAGKLDLEHAPFNLRDCVEGALDIVAPRAWEKELELGCLIDEAAPAGIVGDEARLRQVLLNLLSNAVKFTERGEVVVLVDAVETGTGSYRVELAVRDTGIGIPANRMGQLFTSFSQVDASTTRRFGGTGLGLAISKRLVELMGGTIDVESEEKQGSTFRITLPVAAADVPPRIALDEGLAQLAGKRILIVDDNATNREIVTRHARSWEMEPVAVELPAAALELVEQGEPFDIAVLDMMMPEMDGITLAREVRRHRSEAELPLLLLTSLGRLSQLESEGVFSAQLSKPLKASQLYNTLLQLLTAGRAGDGAAEHATDGKRARSALRILLAEDNAMNQKVALRLLERMGYRADVANNGLEAIEALERQPYDVVLMDVQMPELDGLDATRRIVEHWPPESRPRIIAMTANALPEDREACFAAGMDDYVAKPIRAEELVAALKRATPLENGDGPSARVELITLDDGALKNLRDLGGDDFLGEVIDAFLADAPQLIATLRSSLDAGNNEELRRAAHTLKSNGATLGAEGFAELCRTLEQRTKSGELEGAAELVERIEQAYRPLEEALTALRSESPA